MNRPEARRRSVSARIRGPALRLGQRAATRSSSGSVGDLVVASAGPELVPGGEAEQQAERPPGDLRDERGAVGRWPRATQSSTSRHRSGCTSFWESDIVVGSPVSSEMRGQPVDLVAVAAGHLADALGRRRLTTPPPPAADAPAMPDELLVGRGRARQRAAVLGPVRRQAVGGEARRRRPGRPPRRARPSARCRRRWRARRRRRARPSRRCAAAPWGRWAATSSARGSCSSASRYSGNVSHDHRMPSCSAVPGMSSTPSISWISQLAALGPHGREARRRSCRARRW